MNDKNARPFSTRRRTNSCGGAPALALAFPAASSGGFLPCLNMGIVGFRGAAAVPQDSSCAVDENLIATLPHVAKLSRSRGHEIAEL